MSIYYFRSSWHFFIISFSSTNLVLCSHAAPLSL